MRGDKLTVRDLEQWIDNDEGLYNWCNSWKRENRSTRRAFIRENRAELEACINRVLTGNKPAHYLAYP